MPKSGKVTKRRQNNTYRREICPENLTRDKSTKPSAPARADSCLKTTPPEQLIEAVRTVAAGDALLSPAITKHVIKQFTSIPRHVPPKELDELTAPEQDILRLIARGLSNAEIGGELYISETTVKTHVTHVLQKLGLRDRVQVVVLAYQTGFVQ